MAEGLVTIGGGCATPQNYSSFQQEVREDLPGVYIKTFGCQMNVYDTEKLQAILGDSYRPVSSPEEAELIIVNTCSVREKAEHKLYSLVGSFRTLKSENESLMIGVGGCVAQQEGKSILSRSKEVDFVFGTHNLSLVPQLIEEVRDQATRPVAIDYRDDWEDLPLGFDTKGRASAFVSISRGCNKNCTYCIVPTTRGKEVSRPTDEILREVNFLAAKGVKEIVLLGQTVNSYGLDLTPRQKFSELLAEVAKNDGIERIRFTSPHPQEIRKDFYELLSSNDKICRHVHMPLQSGSDVVLKRMNRNYRKKRYLDIISGLKEVCPDIGITTDIIVGFPGETREDFEETLEVMREVQFDSSYSFAFSPRPGTVAAEMDGQLDEETKKERLYELQALQEEITTRRLDGWLGRDVEVLIDGFAKHQPGQLQGRTSENLLVHLQGDSDALGPGMFVTANLERASRHTLHGRILEGSQRGGLS